jgi:hypothetical protein
VQILALADSKLREKLAQLNQDLKFRPFGCAPPFVKATEGRQGKLYSLRARHRRISAIASTSVLLQFQILFDGVEKSMNNSKDFP